MCGHNSVTSGCMCRYPSVPQAHQHRSPGHRGLPRHPTPSQEGCRIIPQDNWQVERWSGERLVSGLQLTVSLSSLQPVAAKGQLS